MAADNAEVIDEGGDSSGGSSEDGSESDDKPITAKQLKAALASQKRFYEKELAGQKEQFEAFKAGASNNKAPADDKPKAYTRAELKAAVDAGQITQEQADAHWERQRDAEINERAEAVALDAVGRKQARDRLDAEISQYRKLAPEIMEAGSEVRSAIQAEFTALVQAGMPGGKDDNLPTQLAAIKAVLGPLDKLAKARGAHRKQEHDEQGGGSGDGNRPRNPGKGLVNQLDARWKDHYEKGIKQGRYKDWKDVETELKYATPKRRQDMGLPA